MTPYGFFALNNSPYSLSGESTFCAWTSHEYIFSHPVPFDGYGYLRYGRPEEWGYSVWGYLALEASGSQKFEMSNENGQLVIRTIEHCFCMHFCMHNVNELGISVVGTIIDSTFWCQKASMLVTKKQLGVSKIYDGFHVSATIFLDNPRCFITPNPGARVHPTVIWIPCHFVYIMRWNIWRAQKCWYLIVWHLTKRTSFDMVEVRWKMTKKDGPIARWKRSISAAITEGLLIGLAMLMEGWMDAIIFSTCIAHIEGCPPCYSHQLGLWRCQQSKSDRKEGRGCGRKAMGGNIHLVYMCLVGVRSKMFVGKWW